MPIATTCPTCQALFRLPDELAGRKVKCQKCAALFVAPNAGSDATMPSTPVVVGEVEPAAEMAQASVAVAAPPPVIALPPLLMDAPSPPARNDAAAEDDRNGDGPRKRPPMPGKNPDDDRSSRGRRAEKPKPASSKVGIVLGILGLILLAFVTCGVATGIWHVLNSDKDKKAVPIAKDIRKKEFKNPPIFNNQPFPNDGFNGIVQNRPDFDGFKDGELPEPPPEGPPGSIRIIFGPDGKFRDANKITLDDPQNFTKTRHKLYIVRLEVGYTYQFDMTSRDHLALDPFLILRDDKGTWKADNDDILQGQQRDSRLIYTPVDSGIYHLEATYWQPGPGQPGLQNPVGPYTLIVRHVK